MDEKQTNSGLPDNVLAVLNEHSLGGYVLFNFSADGTPMVHAHYDNTVFAMAMKDFITSWSKAVEEIGINSHVSNMIGDDSDEE